MKSDIWNWIPDDRHCYSSNQVQGNEWKTRALSELQHITVAWTWLNHFISFSLSFLINTLEKTLILLHLLHSNILVKICYNAYKILKKDIGINCYTTNYIGNFNSLKFLKILKNRHYLLSISDSFIFQFFSSVIYTFEKKISLHLLYFRNLWSVF